MDDQIKFEGVTLDLGGRTYIVPPLNFARAKKVLPLLTQFSGDGLAALNENAIDACVKVVHLAISRNYPELTLQEVEEGIDLGNVQHVMAVVMGASGIEPVKPGDLRPGEAPPAS